AVLRPVLPHHHIEAGLRIGIHPDRNFAADRHAILHFLRLALRQDRAAEDHPDGLSDRSGHILPAVPGAHALRQPGTRGILGEDKTQVNWFMTDVILVIMVIYVTMVYGPIAAFLVELFPTQIRYTSMSLPYHIGNGWFGGMLPLTATAMVAATGDIYYGLWYPIVVSIMTVIIGAIFLTETKNRDIRTYDHSMLP